ncbi:hypothetical protein [Lewinella sp. IMCC34183]|uniref:hypothetical protein n=1 Tax=Lewinella sp. IMCC34183 TaxID=2248762 RepID=UPI000E2870D0|nr:hypothetical protein [Lewinella sp. IMCC34183]
MKFTYLIALFLLLATACGNSDADTAQEQASMAAQKAAYESMMEGHDRVMPLMNQITQRQRSITEQLSSGTHDEDFRDLLQAAYEQLEDADDAMHEWMNQTRTLDNLRTELDSDKVMEHLRDRTRSIAEVEADMKASIANADQILNDHAGEDHTGEDHSH